MLTIEYSEKAHIQLDGIVSNKGVYDRFGHFTQQFINWNYEFYHYVNPVSISKTKLTSQGWYKIGSIGTLEYKHFTVEDAEIFEIVEFRFSRLPYRSRGSQYRIVSDAGYGYKVVQSTFNGKCAILTPQRRYLTKFAFDSIIGFHHSSKDYNSVYAVGFIGNRVYAIFQNGNIQLLPLSKEEYLSMKHNYYESIKKKRIMISESKLKRIIQQAILEVVGF